MESWSELRRLPTPPPPPPRLALAAAGALPQRPHGGELQQPPPLDRRPRHLGLYPTVTSQYGSTALYQVSYHIQSLFF
jgi:hypothetical protein